MSDLFSLCGQTELPPTWMRLSHMGLPVSMLCPACARVGVCVQLPLEVHELRDQLAAKTAELREARPLPPQPAPVGTMSRGHAYFRSVPTRAAPRGCGRCKGGRLWSPREADHP